VRIKASRYLNDNWLTIRFGVKQQKETYDHSITLGCCRMDSIGLKLRDGKYWQPRGSPRR